MASSKKAIKQVTIRWEDDFWERVAIQAARLRTSVQALVTDAVTEKLAQLRAAKREGGNAV